MSATELLVIAVLALLLIGPRRLPDAARDLGKALREFRRATDGLRSRVEKELGGLEVREPARGAQPGGEQDGAPAASASPNATPKLEDLKPRSLATLATRARPAAAASPAEPGKTGAGMSTPPDEQPRA